MIKNIFWSSYQLPVILVKFLRNEFSRQNFEYSSNIKFPENPFSGSRVVPCGETDGQTDGHDEAYTRFSQLRERA
jgi:hypothetical protein